jgi:ATP-binding cassette, subfamily B, bacterial
MLIGLQTAMLGAGVMLWAQGQASPGDFVSLIATQFLINGYLRDIGQHVRTVQRTVNDMDDVLEFREAGLQVANAPNARALAVDKGRIEFERVTFRYAGAGAPIYEDFSLVIPAGQRVGLVGHSGAGKTTFVKLIQRLYDLDRAASSSTGRTSPRRRRKACAALSGLCRRSQCSSTVRWRRTSPTGGPTRRARRSRKPRGSPMWTFLCAACPRATKPLWASAA